MQSHFDPLVHIDWKTPGGELLGLLQHYYRDIDLFIGQPFEALLDELSNEMPEICFQALANVLAERGYDLWNLDAGGDDYRPVIVATDQREAFARHWQDQEDFTPSLIEPEKPVAAEGKAARKPAKSKRSKLNWLQDVHDYPGPTYVHDDNYHNGWAGITEQDDEQWLCFLIDYNQWPPAEQDMLEHRTDGLDGADLQLIDACGGVGSGVATTARTTAISTKFAKATTFRISVLPRWSGQGSNNPASWWMPRSSSASASTSQCR